LIRNCWCMATRTLARKSMGFSWENTSKRLVLTCRMPGQSCLRGKSSKSWSIDLTEHCKLSHKCTAKCNILTSAEYCKTMMTIGLTGLNGTNSTHPQPEQTSWLTAFKPHCRIQRQWR